MAPQPLSPAEHEARWKALKDYLSAEMQRMMDAARRISPDSAEFAVNASERGALKATLAKMRELEAGR